MAEKLKMIENIKGITYLRYEAMDEFREWFFESGSYDEME